MLTYFIYNISIRIAVYNEEEIVLIMSIIEFSNVAFNVMSKDVEYVVTFMGKQFICLC